MSKMKADIEPINENVRNCDEMRVALTIEGYEVVEWHPLPNGEGEPTQVHIILNLPDLPCNFRMRLKSRHAAEQMIAALTRHTLNVWPDGHEQ